ncbi:FkbM family methyltransferase [Infirmifilum lucidum]|uniref:FkbM family methyltransferase n=1 Tax=Infirmifilum lucidum TaxID=2776706 RepID=A0A7L9FFT1_9CREN|nr:FkbM family methyltransferase [Infirmifilum lucidum]QOJ78547.1 FkbM family methyltransferase [Infirmifilum lucidum]
MGGVSLFLRMLEKTSVVPELLGSSSTVIPFPPYHFVIPVSEVEEAKRNIEHIFVYRDYERFPEFSPAEAHSIVDLGAYLGFYTVRALRLSRKSRVVSVEANPVSCMYTIWNVALQGGADRARVLCRAVDSERGAGRFYVGLSMVNSSLLREYVDEFTSVAREIIVPKVTLLDVFQASGFRRIDLLKVDIEGVEKRVFEKSLEALEQFGVERIVVELHEGFSYARQLSDILSAGYSVYVVRDEDVPFQSFLYAVRRR